MNTGTFQRRGEAGEGDRVLAVAVALFALPFLVGVLATAGFVWWLWPTAPPRPQAGAAAPCSFQDRAPCTALGDALKAAEAADSERLGALLSDPAWLGRLPAADTSTPRERGQLWLRMIVGEPPGSLEELQLSTLKVLPVGVRTALDGSSAEVLVEVRSMAEASPGRRSLVRLERVGGVWRLVPPAPGQPAPLQEPSP